MKIFIFWFIFHWNLFLRVKLQCASIGSDDGLALNRWQAIIWTNEGIVYWCIFVGLILMFWHRKTHITHKGTDKSSWTKRGLNLLPPDWGNNASCPACSLSKNSLSELLWFLEGEWIFYVSNRPSCINSLRQSDASVNLAIIGSDNGLVPDWHQAIIWTNGRIFLIWSLRISFIERYFN